METIKIRINEQIVNISVQKCNNIDEVRKRSVTINKYKRFLTKIIK